MCSKERISGLLAFELTLAALGMEPFVGALAPSDFPFCKITPA